MGAGRGGGGGVQDLCMALDPGYNACMCMCMQVRDVVVGLDGNVLHDTTLAMSLAKHPEDTIMLSVVRPGEPVVNQGWLAAQQARPNSRQGKEHL